MKQTILLLMATLGSLAGLLHAKTITVDNRVGSVAMFSNLQSAINAADHGDTILIAGSPNSYGDVAIGKRLKLVGSGYFLTENQIDGITKQSSFIKSITFGAHSSETFQSNPNGSEIIGLHVDSVGSAGLNWVSIEGLNYSGNVSGIIMDSCRIGGITNSFLNYNSKSPSLMYFSARRCWLGGGGVPTGSSLRNCMVVGGIEFRAGSTVDHCILQAADTRSQAESLIVNSIFVASGSGPTAASFANNCKGSVDYCMAVGGLPIQGSPTFLKPGVGNHPTIGYLETVFQYGNPVDRQFLLAPESPARGIGLNGVDLGMFGGATPYIISGVPPLPRITHFSTPASATSSSGLRFELKAKSF